MTYTWIRREEIDVPKIQERFIELFYEVLFENPEWSHERCHQETCNRIVNQYKLQPPYPNYSSFKSIMTKRSKKR